MVNFHFKGENRIFIGGNVPSSKNSKVKTSRGVFNSKAVSKYLQHIGVASYSSSKKIVKDYKTRPNDFKKAFQDAKWTKPSNTLILGFHFIRNTKRLFDFNNVNQIILDLMTSHDFIEDDNIKYVLPIPIQLNGAWYTVDKFNPGVYLFY